MIQLKLLLLTISPRIHPPTRKLQPQWLLPVRKTINRSQELVGLELLGHCTFHPQGPTQPDAHQEKGSKTKPLRQKERRAVVTLDP